MKTLLFYICHTVIFASLLLQTLLNTLHNHIPYPHTHTRACTHWKYQVHNTTFLFHLPVSCCFVWLFIVFYVECYFLLVKYPFSPHFLYLLLLCMYNFSPSFHVCSKLLSLYSLFEICITNLHHTFTTDMWYVRFSQHYKH